jgi:hypothetical protein
LALACLEGDVLWPLHPIGVLADLDRPGKGEMSEDQFDPPKWHKQLKQSLQTLVESRSKWKDINDGDFIDRNNIFRSEEGHRLYSAWRKLWNLDEEKTP